MTIHRLRTLVAVVCVASIAGMIVGSVQDNNGVAITAGAFAALAVCCLLAANAVHLGSNGGGAQEALAAELEARIAELVAAGADEARARDVVRKAIRFGRGQPTD